jgi:hypothetical protein
MESLSISVGPGVPLAVIGATRQQHCTFPKTDARMLFCRAARDQFRCQP